MVSCCEAGASSIPANVSTSRAISASGPVWLVTVDVDGLVVTPGFVDVHVHLREPGQEWKETLATGTAAAAAGGFTTVFCMPNTEPALDSVAALAELRRRADREAIVRVVPIAAISEQRRGERAVDYETLARYGVAGFSDDGQSTLDSSIMMEALDASRRFGVPVMVHCEDPALANGAMHDGAVAGRLGVPGIPAAAEEIYIDRDLTLARLTGGWLHVCHVSTAKGAERIGAARREGVQVTAEVTPHHLVMNDEWVATDPTSIGSPGEERPAGLRANPDAKVNPPLRTHGDANALVDALTSGVIDLVATDHAPHAAPEKRGRSFADAALGLSGSEFALPLMLDLVRAGRLALFDVVRALSCTPARLWNLAGGTLRPGAKADIAIFDVDEPWCAIGSRLISRGSNTPLLGTELKGRVKWTIIDGDERHCDW